MWFGEGWCRVVRTCSGAFVYMGRCECMHMGGVGTGWMGRLGVLRGSTAMLWALTARMTRFSNGSRWYPGLPPQQARRWSVRSMIGSVPDCSCFAVCSMEIGELLRTKLYYEALIHVLTSYLTSPRPYYIIQRKGTCKEARPDAEKYR